MKVWINNKFVDARDAKISVFDRGFLYGDGLFETMRAYRGSIFLLDRHLSRLFDSAKAIRMHIPYSKKALREASCDSIERNGLKDAYIRITVTRGGSVIILTKKIKARPRSDYINGISVKVSKIVLNENSPLAGKKSLNYLNYLLAKEDAMRDGCGEAILFNTKGDVAEGATSNIFLVKNKKLITPSLDSGILPGITRQTVIAIAKKMKISVIEKRVLPKELMSADEAFITNSIMELLPVKNIGHAKIGRGRPGEMTKLLHAAYRKML